MAYFWGGVGSEWESLYLGLKSVPPLQHSGTSRLSLSRLVLYLPI